MTQYKIHRSGITGRYYFTIAGKAYGFSFGWPTYDDAVSAAIDELRSPRMAGSTIITEVTR